MSLEFSFKKMLFVAVVVMMAGLLVSAFAQAPDLDLADERLLSVVVSGDSGQEDARFRAVSVVAPFDLINGGAYLYGSQTIIGESSVDAFQWRVQGGPLWRGASLQFYVDSINEKRLDYAWFIRPGAFSLGQVSFSGGLGTLLRQDTRVELGEDDASGDRVVKGLLFVSGHYKRDDFNFDARATFVPGFDGEHDLTFEPSATFDLGKFSLTGQAFIGYHLGMFESDYTLLLNVPF